MASLFLRAIEAAVCQGDGDVLDFIHGVLADWWREYDVVEFAGWVTFTGGIVVFVAAALLTLGYRACVGKWLSREGRRGLPSVAQASSMRCLDFFAARWTAAVQ